jgi:hypothetical protein
MPKISVAQMRRGIRKATGIYGDTPDVEDPDLTTVEIDLYLNRALWELDNKFPFKEKEKTVTFNLVIGTRNYDVPQPFDAVQTVAIFDRYSMASRTLHYMEPFEYENNYTEGVDFYGKPTHYTRESCFIRFWPTPDFAYKISLKRLITLDDVSDANQYPDVPQVWHEIIQFGGLWRAFIDMGDLARANQIKNHQIALINSTIPTQDKEEGRDKFAGVEVLRSDYDGGRWWDNR